MTRYGTKMMKKFLTLILFVFAFVFVGNQFVNVDAFSGNKTVTITGIYDGSTALVDTDSIPYGSKVSMDISGAPEGQTFAFWIVNGIVQPTFAVNHQFVITNNMDLKVVFTPSDKVVAVFMDVNGGYLGSRFVTSGGSADTSEIALPYRPGFESVDGVGRWTKVFGSDSVSNITQNSVFVQNYVDDATSNTVNIVVNNGTGTEVKNFNSIVTAVANAAPEGQKFSHWLENGIKVSAQESYKFTALYDREITAVYVPVATSIEDEVIVTISSDIEKRSGYHTYVGQIQVPATYEVIEYGFFIGNEAIILNETNNSHVVQGTNIHPVTNEFVSSISIGSHMSVRAYVVVKNGETQTIVTSEVNHRYMYDSTYSVGFEDLTGSNPLGYAATSVTSGGILWDTHQAYIASNDVSDKKNGTYAVRLRSNFETGVKAYIQTNHPIENVKSISLNYAWYGTHVEGRLFISISKDKDNWIHILTNQSPTDALQNVKVNIDYSSTSVVEAGINAGDSIYIQVRNENVTGTNKSINIDNVIIETLYKGSTVKVVYDELNGNINSTFIKSNEKANSYTPIKTGYTFVNWYDTPEFSGSAFDFDVELTTDVQLYAKWSINEYTISFEENDGSAVENITQDYNTVVTEPSDPTKDGYTFAGWFTEIELINVYTFTTMPAVSITLYAKWNINEYTITFEENSGSEVANITQDYNTTVTKPADPTKDGYTFAGWFTEISFENEYIFSTMPLNGITLYAKWLDASSTATVSFNSDGGSEVSSEVVDIDGLVTEPDDPTKTGYSFVKWNNSFGEEWIFNVDTVTEDITLTAVWQINEYTISFNVNGGTEVASITQDYGTVVVKPADPTRDGYTFDTWYSNIDLTNVYTFTTMPAQNTTLYAKWNGPVTVTASYSGPTGNMTASNNAATIGLDSSIFNVTSTQRTVSPLHVGLNSSGQIRLYGSSDGNGNVLTISINEDYIIKEVVFNFGATVGKAIIMTDSTTQFNGSLTSNSTLTYSTLDASQFSIKNTNTSTGQIYILSISITYSQVNP